MSHPRVATEDPQSLPRELQELQAAIAQLPGDQRQTLEPLVDRVAEGARRRRRILSLVQDALSQLRLDLKYLMFDLDATRRERDEFQRQLEGS